jgi:hypothetical protein
MITMKSSMRKKYPPAESFMNKDLARTIQRRKICKKLINKKIPKTNSH